MNLISFNLHFLNLLICSNTNLTTRDLEVSTRTGNPVFEFVHKYPQWLMNNLIGSEDINKLVFIHLLIIKLFNLNSIFISHENRNAFAIIFLYDLSKYYNEKINLGESPRLSLFYSKTNGIIDSFFIKDFISKTPILDLSEKSYYTKGFYLTRDKFLKLVEEAEILNNDFSDEPFSDLFVLYFSISLSAKQKIIKEIINKIKRLEFPKQEDLTILNQFTGVKAFDEINPLVYRKLYLY